MNTIARRWVPLALALLVACGPRVDVMVDIDSGRRDGSILDAGTDAPLTPGECGDGELNVGEACDDGNTNRSDGCNPACGIEDGWSCAGSPSVCSESCGDGEIDDGESCDDGDAADGDGCSASCAVEGGWACAGAPSACASICGDGLRVGVETDAMRCDDGNTVADDGCSPTCSIEPGWSCGGAPSVCATGCGDGIVAGAEACDDGDATDGDGCSMACTVEDGWACAGSPSACSTSCGDGIVAGAEACDDSDADAGDGCSGTCTIERGYACAGEPSVCATECGDGILAGAETCDDADVEAGDGCSEACQTEFAFGCTGEPSVCIQVDRAIGVALGDTHGCAWTFEQRVRCWGGNVDGQLGDGTAETRALPITVPVYDVVEVDVGARFSCALRDDGTVWCWGSDGSGQQGPGITGARRAPGAVAGLTGASAIATGGEHACALVGTEVQCWGDNDNRQLGRGGTGTTDSDLPTGVAIGMPATSMDLGEDHTCAVLADGSIACWGDDDNGQLGDGGSNTDQSLPVPVMLPAGALAVEVSAGDNHTCARTATGGVLCWGDNARGQLGAGTADAVTPIAVTLPGPATAIRAGARHTCALVGAQPYCWGDNVDGQLGDGTRIGGATPVIVSGVSTRTLVALATGDRGTCALGDDGRRVCWGESDDGSLGILPLDQPMLGVETLTGPASTLPALAATRSGGALVSGDVVPGAFCAVVNPGAGGALRCWGDSESGLLPSASGADLLVPTTMSAPTGVTQVAMGQDFACALGAGGAVSCWGEGGHRQLGQGASTADSAAPVAVMSLPTDVLQLVAGQHFACTRHADGRVLCWGHGAQQQVGIAALTDSGVPTAIPDISGATAVCTGALHGCAVVAGGEVRCWGSDSRGQNGDGSPMGYRHNALPVMGLGAATDVACGEEHSCARLADGTVWCWGENGQGQLGNGGTMDASAPQLVLGITGTARGLFAGWDHTCAIHDPDRVSCWGDNDHGQLGDGTTADATMARAMAGVATASMPGVASGAVTCVRDTTGIRCAGFRGFAQLGDGTTLRPLTAIGAPL